MGPTSGTIVAPILDPARKGISSRFIPPLSQSLLLPMQSGTARCPPILYLILFWDLERPLSRRNEQGESALGWNWIPATSTQSFVGGQNYTKIDAVHTDASFSSYVLALMGPVAIPLTPGDYDNSYYSGDYASGFMYVCGGRTIYCRS